MRVTTLAGTGPQRGLDHGREFATEIASTVTACKTHLAATGHPPDPLARRLMTSPLVAAASEAVPDLWAEVVAMAGGARLPLDDVLLLVFLDEVWGITRPGQGCSAVARIVPSTAHGSPRSTTEIGQTMDLPAWAFGRAQVLRIGAGDAPTALVLSYAGALGLCGANEAGLGVAVNALPNATFDEAGLGVQFILRQLLTLSTLADAERFLRAVPHAAGQAYTVAAPDGLACFEADGDGVRDVALLDPPGIAHTNHWLAPDESASARESSRERLLLLRSCLSRRGDFAHTLDEEVIVDGERWGDRFSTFGAFRAVGDEPCVRFVDGAALRAGHRDWSRVTFR